MKKIINILILVSFILICVTCKKDPDLRMPALEKGALLNFEKLSGKDASLNFANLSGSQLGYKISVVYNASFKSVKLYSEFTRIGKTWNNKSDSVLIDTIAVFKSGITTLPTNINFTAQDIVSTFPSRLKSLSDIAQADNFIFAGEVTLQDGTILPAFNDSIDHVYRLAISPGITVWPNYGPSVGYTVACPFVASLDSGNYQMVSVDWNVNATVKLEADKNNLNEVYINGLAEADGLISNGKLMKLVIDPVTSIVSGDATAIAPNCAPWGAQYASDTNYSYKVVSGEFNNCAGSYTIKFDIFSDKEDFGTYNFTFTRK